MFASRTRLRCREDLDEATGHDVPAEEQGACGRPVTPEPQEEDDGRMDSDGGEPEGTAIEDVTNEVAGATGKDATNGVGGATGQDASDPQTRDDDETDADRGDPEVAAIADAIDQGVARQRIAAVDGEPDFSPTEARRPPATPWPMNAFGDKLTRWACALEVLTGTHFALCAATLLAFVNLAIHALVDIRFFRMIRPTSLFILIVASSGERKSSAYDWLMKPVLQFEAELQYEHDQQKATLEPKDAEKLPEPRVVFSDHTTPALYRALAKSRGTLSLFVDEAGVFLGGYSLRSEQHLELVSQLSKLYDASKVTTLRCEAGVTSVVGKRFNMFLTGPWSVIGPFVANPQSRQQGLISRCAVSYPPSRIGSRLKGNRTEADEA